MRTSSRRNAIDSSRWLSIQSPRRSYGVSGRGCVLIGRAIAPSRRRIHRAAVAAIAAASKCARKCTSACVARFASAAVIVSSGWWLMPPLPQRTNSMPIGATCAISMASWPAPLGSRNGSMPCAATLAASAACSRSSHGAAASSNRLAHSSATLRRSAIARHSRSIAATAASRSASRPARTSIVSATSPGITLIAPPPATASLPTVPTSTPRDAAVYDSTKSVISVAARAHRHGARMAGQAGPAGGDPRRAGDRRDDAECQVAIEQYRALLDMDLDECRDVVVRARKRRNCVGIAAERDDRVAQRRSLGIAAVEQRRIEATRQRATSDHRKAEAHAFLVTERDDLDRVWQLDATRGEVAGGGDCAQDAEDAVVAAGIDDAVEVRAGDDARRIGPCACASADDVAERVDLDGEAGVAHPAGDQRRRTAVLSGEITSREDARILADRGERVALLEDAGAE